ELIDRSWEHYRRDFVDLVSVSGWILVPAILNIVALSIYPAASKIIGAGALTRTEGIGVGLYAFSTWIVAPIIGLWAFVAVVRLVRSELSGRRGGVREAMADGKRYFAPTLVVSALIFLVMLAVVAIGFAPSAILALISYALGGNTVITVLSGVAAIVGILAALVLGVRWTVHYYFAPFALLIDEVRGKETLTASRKLVEGKFWSVLLRLAVPKIVYVLIGAILMAIVGFVLSIATTALTGLNSDVQLRLTTIVTSVLSTMVAALLNPVIVSSDVMLYQSLKR
ncbi:hypothetical protein EBS80_05205, partial [bacterium]|nr:hypothetical protein [bacterium]